MAEENYGWQTWFDDISPPIADRLVAKVPGMTRDRVFSSSLPDQFHMDLPPADQFITLFFPRARPVEGAVSGGGTYTTAIDAIMTSKAFVRQESDVEAKTTRWLEDNAFGLYKFVLKIVTALQIWRGPLHPATELSLFRRPMRLIDMSIDKGSSKTNGRWGVCELKWDVAFVASLGTDYTGIILS